jgi:hypothetical protein
MAIQGDGRQSEKSTRSDIGEELSKSDAMTMIAKLFI